MNKKIHLSRATNLPKDPIDDIFAQVPIINEIRHKEGLSPIINLGVGEPHLRINETILLELHQFLNHENSSLAFQYSPLKGHPHTLAAICRLYNNYYPRAHFTINEVMISNGATQGLWNAFSILIDEGDEVLAFEPYFSTYEAQVRRLGGRLVKIPTQNNHFKPCNQSLTTSLKNHPKAKIVIFNYPNNPTGIDLDEFLVKELAQTLKQHPFIAIIIDDVYRELGNDEHITVLDVDPSLKERCIVINSASKGLLGAPGMRIGMVGANSGWINQMTTIQGLTVSSIATLTEKILISGINQKILGKIEYQDWLNKTKNEYRLNVQLVSSQLKLLGFNVISGESGFFVLADASFLMGKKIPNTILLNETSKTYMNNLHEKIGATLFKTDLDIVSFLLHAAGIAVIPGSAFGIDPCKGYMRFSCAKNINELKQALHQLRMSFTSFISNKLISQIEI